MVIYKITNLVNGKLYIVQTTDYKGRVRQHKQIPFRENSKEKHKPLYKAMIKYGLDNFKFEIIDTANSIEELNEKEIYYIKEYDTCVDNNNGYNLDKGGSNGYKSEETKKKIGDAQRGILNHAYGKRGGDCHNAKRVINATINKIYPSMLDCAVEEYGDKKYLKQISKVCDPKSTYRGNVYKLLDNKGNTIDKEYVKVNDAFNKIQVIDLLSGKVFDSISETAKYFKISSSMVRDRVYDRVKNDKHIKEFILKVYSQQ